MILAAAHHRAWRQLPCGTLDDIVGSGTCVVLAPHPDDESLGCGGLIAACVAAKRPPRIVFLTDGAASHPNSKAFPAARLKALRAEEARDAAGHLGLSPDRLSFLDIPDTKAPSKGVEFDQLLIRFRMLIDEGPACTRLLAPWIGDPHCDHQAAAQLASASGLPHLSYPVWGWTLPEDQSIDCHVSGGLRFDIRQHLPAKREAIRAHTSQYGGIIKDDPSGFTLSSEFLALFDQPYETFLVP